MRSRHIGRSVLIGTVTPNRNGRVAPVVLESVIACPFVARISARLVVRFSPARPAESGLGLVDNRCAGPGRIVRVCASTSNSPGGNGVEAQRRDHLLLSAWR